MLSHPVIFRYYPKSTHTINIFQFYILKLISEIAPPYNNFKNLLLPQIIVITNSHMIVVIDKIFYFKEKQVFEFHVHVALFVNEMVTTEQTLICFA